MNFTVEQTQKGKPSIIYGGYRFREYRTLRSGEISYRCLGRSCGASVKTDSMRSTITVSNPKHSGDHPVTMRTLSASPSASSHQSSPASTPTGSVSHSTPESASFRVPELFRPKLYCAATQTEEDHMKSKDQLIKRIDQLTDREGGLIDKIQELTLNLEKAQETIQFLNTKIVEIQLESDLSRKSSGDEINHKNDTAGAQRDAPISSSTIECAVQCDMPLGCQDERCDQDRTLILSLRTTIEVLEAEINALKTELTQDSKTCVCKVNPQLKWTKCVNKNNNIKSAIDLKNRFECLSNVLQEEDIKEDKEIQKNESTRKKPQQRRMSYWKHSSSTKTELSFQTIVLESDSHGRHIAGLVEELLNDGTRVMGVCKPGARLMNVVSSQPPPPGSCYVVMAGTNDLANKHQHNFCQNLEQCVTTKMKTSRVIVSTIPHRHDLPAQHPINKETAHVNKKIKTLAAKHEGVDILDFNQIGRRLFTRHGMHLRMLGKRVLARLLVASIKELDRPAAALQTTTVPVPDAASRTVTTAADLQEGGAPLRDVEDVEPVTLPYDSYADAVKRPVPYEAATQDPSLDVPFLEINLTNRAQS